MTELDKEWLKRLDIHTRALESLLFTLREEIDIALKVVEKDD